MKLPSIEEEDVIWVRDYAHAHPILAGRLNRIADRLTAKPVTEANGWRDIEGAPKEHADGQQPILTWGATFGYGLTYGPINGGGYGPQTHYQPLPEPPSLSERGERG